MIYMLQFEPFETIDYFKLGLVGVQSELNVVNSSLIRIDMKDSFMQKYAYLAMKDFTTIFSWMSFVLFMVV